MTTSFEEIRAERQQRHAAETTRRLVRALGESYKTSDWPTPRTEVYGEAHEIPESVPVEVAARAAEMAYRRGVTQGAYYMLWRIHGQPPNSRPDPNLPGYAYADELMRWRDQGRAEQYARAEDPPRAENPAYVAPGRASTWVYFIQDSHSGAIKIGKANRPEKRLKALQTGAPYPLSLLGVITADESTESTLHERFGHLLIRGEWFRPEPELLAFVNRWAADPDSEGHQLLSKETA